MIGHFEHYFLRGRGSGGEYLPHQLLRQILWTNHLGAWTFQDSVGTLGSRFQKTHKHTNHTHTNPNHRAKCVDSQNNLHRDAFYHKNLRTTHSHDLLSWLAASLLFQNSGCAFNICSTPSSEQGKPYSGMTFTAALRRHGNKNTGGVQVR